MMRFLAASAALAALATSCDKHRTEIVLGIATDLPAPMSLDRVTLNVFRQDASGEVPVLQCEDGATGCSAWDLKNKAMMGLYDLPGSYGIYSSDGTEPRVRIEVIGSQGGVERVRRTTITSLVSHQTLFMRMTLVLKCMVGNPNAVCPSGTTCIEGTCQPLERDPHTMPAYATGLESKFQCASGTTYIDTSKGNAPVAVSGSCGPNEECQEGTCYKKPAAADGGALSSATYGGACTNGVTSCAAPTRCHKLYSLSTGYCRAPCTSPAECTMGAPEATASVLPQWAGCETSFDGNRYCTFPCDPTISAAGASGCHAEAVCIATRSPQADTPEYITDCATPRPTTAKTDGQPCTSDVGECAPGFTCTAIQAADMAVGTSVCRAICALSRGKTNNMDCNGIQLGWACCPLQRKDSSPSTLFGACLPAGSC
jgi:hypothetical protein